MSPVQHKYDVKDVEIGQFLGKGCFGSVYLAVLKPLNKKVACKIITINKENSSIDAI